MRNLLRPDTPTLVVGGGLVRNCGPSIAMRYEPAVLAQEAGTFKLRLATLALNCSTVTPRPGASVSATSCRTVSGAYPALLQSANLEMGDILIGRLRTNSSDTCRNIARAQRLFVHNVSHPSSGGASNASHTAIVTYRKHEDLGATSLDVPMIAEATPLRTRMASSLRYQSACPVYRLVADPVKAGLAAAVAETLVTRGAVVPYDKLRAVNALFGSACFGSSARERVQTYKARYEREGRGPNHAFCSEFVILCYQIALDFNDPYCPQLDAKHSTPKNLEGSLNQARGWRLMGRFGMSNVA
jgi:hypothetical protein